MKSNVFLLPGMYFSQQYSRIKGYHFFLKIRGMKSEMGLRGLKISPKNLRGRKFFGQKIRGAKNLGHFPENTPGGYPDLIVSTP